MTGVEPCSGCWQNFDEEKRLQYNIFYWFGSFKEDSQLEK